MNYLTMLFSKNAALKHSFAKCEIIKENFSPRKNQADFQTLVDRTIHNHRLELRTD